MAREAVPQRPQVAKFRAEIQGHPAGSASWRGGGEAHAYPIRMRPLLLPPVPHDGVTLRVAYCQQLMNQWGRQGPGNQYGGEASGHSPPADHPGGRTA